MGREGNGEKAEIGYRAMKLDEYESSVWYRVACDCHDTDHEATIEIEYDKDLEMVFVNFYVNLEWYRWADDGVLDWFRQRWGRIKAAARILFTGWIKMESGLILGDSEHIDSLIQVLTEGREILEKRRSGHGEG